MKYFKFIFLLTVAFFAYSFHATAADPEHFIPVVQSGDNMTLIIPVANVPKIGIDNIVAGDEVGVFTPGGVCAGAGVWDGVNDLALALFADDEFTDEVDGFVAGDAISFRLWASADDTEYPNVTVGWGSRTLPTYQATFNGKYSNNVLANINSLTAAATPKQVTITNPTNNSINVTTSGNITWTGLANATSYDVQLSTTNTYATKIIDANLTGTSQAYTGLANGTTYYVRVRGLNSEGAGNWREHSFKTQLATPTLTSPANNAVAQLIAGNMTWSAVTGADNYLLQVSTDANFNTTVINNATLTTNSFAYTALNNNTTYYWRVKATATGGDESAFSSVYQFKTVVGIPTLTTPANLSYCISTGGVLMFNSVSGATAYEIQLASDVAFQNVVSQNLNVNGISHTYNLLNNNTVYFWRVKAKNADGAGDYSAVWSFTTVLAAPTLQSPSNDAISSATSGFLSWASVDGATAYEVLLATDMGFTAVVLTDANVASATKAYAGLNNNTTYYWKVRAKNANCTGAWSNTFNFETVLAAPVLATPANNAVNIPVSGNVTWNAVNGATSYDVQIASDNGFTTFLVNQTGVVGNTLAYTNLNNKSVHYWRVRAVKTGSISDWSATFQFTSHLTAATLLAPANNAQGQALASSIQWQSLTGVTGYDYVIATDMAFANIVVQGNTANTTINYSGLNYNTVYYWRVRGTDGFGPGPWSTTFNFETVVAAPVLATPEDESVDVPLLGSLDWNASAGAATYDVQISELENFSVLKVNKTGVVGTTTSYSGLTPDTDQFWRVRGVKAGVAGPWSAVFTFKTVQIEPPTLLSPANNANGTLLDVTLDWEPVLNGTSYNVELATDVLFEDVIASGTELADTEFDVMGLSYGTTYYWRGQSNGDLGSSNWSEPFSFTTIPAPSYTGVTTVCESTIETYYAPESDVIDYNWTVEGGTIQGSSTMRTVTVKWGAAGYGSLTLTRSSEEWGEFTDFIEKEIGINPQTVITISVNIQKYYAESACMNETVNFIATTGSAVTTWVWDLGDGTFKNGRIVSHKYETPGTYDVVVYAVGPNCRVGEKASTLVVSDECDITIVVPSATEYTCKNTPFTFAPIVFGGTGEYTYNWTPSADFVDATLLEGTVRNPVSNKSFTLTATDANSGEYGTKAISLNVRNNPSVTLKRSTLTLNNNNPINLNDYRNNASSGTAPYTYGWTYKVGDSEVTVEDPENEYPPLGTTQYYLKVVDANGCVSTARRFVVFKSLSKEFNDNDVIAGVNNGSFMFTYPNPVKDYLNIFAEFTQETNVNIRLVDMLGQDVTNLNKGTMMSMDATLDLSGLTSGVYMLIIEIEGDTLVKKIVKE